MQSGVFGRESGHGDRAGEFSLRCISAVHTSIMLTCIRDFAPGLGGGQKDHPDRLTATFALSIYSPSHFEALSRDSRLSLH